MQIATNLPREVAQSLAHAEFWIPRIVRVAVILTGAWLTTAIARRLLARMRAYATRAIDRHHDLSAEDLEKRANTVASALAKIVGTVVWLVAIVMALNELTFNVEPLLAGLGVAGLALGLGAQALIKDWIGGVLILVEDQIRIGDSVVINGISGAVEEINLRTTMLRGENGAVHFIPNGGINTISNMTREYAYAMLETTLAHAADGDQALALVTQAASEAIQDPQLKEWVLGKMELLSMDRLTVRGITIRARIKTVPGKQGLVARDWNRRVKIALEQAKIPFPPVTT
jgi:small-conductance mechanosensitive channel